jgi:hypothetical protein
VQHLGLSPFPLEPFVAHPKRAKPKKPNWNRFDVDIDVVDQEETKITILVQAPESKTALKLYVTRNAKIVSEHAVPAKP